MILLILFLIGSTSCNVIDTIRGLNEKKLSTQEFLRLIITAIDDEDKVSDAYASLPPSQVDGLSYSYFSEYLDIIRKTTFHSKGEVTSFSIIEDEDLSRILTSNKIDSANIGCSVIKYYQSNKQAYFFYNIDSEGNAYISEDWALGIINIYSYAEHYFTMIDNQNVEGVYTLLRPGITDSYYSTEAIYARAEALIDFYSFYVKSTISEYEVNLLTPSNFDITIPEVINSNQSEYEKHKVFITADNNGGFLIEDLISTPPDAALSYIYNQEGDRVLHVGSTYSNEELYSVLGTPSSIYIPRTNSQGVDDEEDDLDSMIIAYEDMLIILEGTNLDESSFSGDLVSVYLYSGCQYSLGNIVSTGDSVSKILEHYPFIDLSSGELDFDSMTNSYNISFSIDVKDEITYINIST